MKIKKSNIIEEYDSVCVYCLAPGEHSCCGENHFSPAILIEQEFRGIYYQEVYLSDEIEVIDESKPGIENNVLTVLK